MRYAECRADLVRAERRILCMRYGGQQNNEFVADLG
jgi:hypothetical protein